MLRPKRSHMDFWPGAWPLSLDLPSWTTVINIRRASSSNCCPFSPGPRMYAYGAESSLLTYRLAVRSRDALAMRAWSRTIKWSPGYLNRANLTDSQIHDDRCWLFYYYYYYLIFIYFLGLHCCARAPLVAASGGYSSLWCVGFSLWWLLLLQNMGSRHASFSSCGMRAQ